MRTMDGRKRPARSGKVTVVMTRAGSKPSIVSSNSDLKVTVTAKTRSTAQRDRDRTASVPQSSVKKMYRVNSLGSSFVTTSVKQSNSKATGAATKTTTKTTKSKKSKSIKQ